MSPHLNKSVTLLELLIAISLLGILVLAFTSIDLFSRYHVRSADIRSQLQNEASFVLEHMSKQIPRAIGNEWIDGADAVVEDEAFTNNGIVVYIDWNLNGRRDTIAAGDRRIAYRWYPVTAPPANRYQIRYCPQCTTASCTICTPAWGTVADNTLSRKIIACTFIKPETGNILTDNYVEVSITTCYDPDETPDACGTPDNPQVEMRTRIKMPAVSTH